MIMLILFIVLSSCLTGASQLEESLVLTRSMATRSDVFSGMTDSGSSQHQAPQSQGYTSSSSRATAGDGLADGAAAAGYRQQAISQTVDEQASRSVGFVSRNAIASFDRSFFRSIERTIDRTLEARICSVLICVLETCYEEFYTGLVVLLFLLVDFYSAISSNALCINRWLLWI